MELSVLVRAHCNFDILCFKNRLNGLNLVPCLQVILCEDCIFCASPVVLFWIFCNVACVPVIAENTHIRIRILILDAFAIDHSVRPSVSFTMARTLVHYAEILAHVFLFFAVHIVGRLYFAICNVSKSLRLHCFFFKSVSGQASDKLILSDSIWLERTFFKVGMITHGFSWTI